MTPSYKNIKRSIYSFWIGNGRLHATHRQPTVESNYRSGREASVHVSHHVYGQSAVTVLLDNTVTKMVTVFSVTHAVAALSRIRSQHWHAYDQSTVTAPSRIPTQLSRIRCQCTAAPRPRPHTTNTSQARHSHTPPIYWWCWTGVWQ